MNDLIRHQTYQRINAYIQKIYITDKEIENCARKIRKYSENLTTQSQLKSQLEIMLVNLQSYSSKLIFLKIKITIVKQFFFKKS